MSFIRGGCRIWGGKDAIPGFVNEAWTKVDQPGVYRGKCAELCGKDHGFMPIVVVAKAPEDYAKWVAERRASPKRRRLPLIVNGQGRAAREG